MVERGNGLRFPLKPLSNSRVDTLIATVRSSLVSRALYTSPIPPCSDRRDDFIRAEFRANG